MSKKEEKACEEAGKPPPYQPFADLIGKTNQACRIKLLQTKRDVKSGKKTLDEALTGKPLPSQRKKTKKTARAEALASQSNSETSPVPQLPLPAFLPPSATQSSESGDTVADISDHSQISEQETPPTSNPRGTPSNDSDETVSETSRRSLIPEKDMPRFRSAEGVRPKPLPKNKGKKVTHSPEDENAANALVSLRKGGPQQVPNQMAWGDFAQFRLHECYIEGDESES